MNSNGPCTSRQQQKQKQIQHHQPRSLFYVWWTAARPHTLTASLCPCLVSFSANYYNYNLNDAVNERTQYYRYFYPIAFLWTLFCISVQLGTNLHNDYSDYVQGADDKKTRVGHIRATAAGWLTPQQTCIGATICLVVTFSCGICLIFITNQWDNGLVWFIILSSIFNAFAYTGGPYPLGFLLGKSSIAYLGLGDIFVFIYFGLVATYMIPYLLYCTFAIQNTNNDNMQVWSIVSLYRFASQAIYGVQVGLLAMNILIVNNLRDRNTDVLVNKLTSSVRFGKRFSYIQYILCLLATFSLVGLDALLLMLQPLNDEDSTIIRLILLRLLPYLSIPIAYKEVKAVLTKDGSDLNPHVGGAAKVQTLFCVLLTVSLFLQKK